mmetsp:Transcript_9828/g.9927  ORF Transcript_9828/g.9927 Transcript_9828/m.9927 type:complete len:270 (-) Transcript_9828:111-920(-)
MNYFTTLQLSPWSIFSFLCICLGHTLFSTILQFFFYYTRYQDHDNWKIQCVRKYVKNQNHLSIVSKWWLPILCQKPNRGAYHHIFTTVNLLISSTFSCLLTELSLQGYSKLQFSSIEVYGMLQIFIDALYACILQSIIEYYWHRLMHIPICYKYLHKYHHYYKSPEPWDDLYIHPIEATGYYCILFCPPFLFSMHVFSYIIYMIIMGTCGVLDHSGIHFSFPYLYNTADHDLHHSKYNVNYAFPFPYMDLLHGTYEGQFLGRKYSPHTH